MTVARGISGGLTESSHSLLAGPPCELAFPAPPSLRTIITFCTPGMLSALRAFWAAADRTAQVCAFVAYDLVRPLQVQVLVPAVGNVIGLTDVAQADITRGLELFRVVAVLEVL